MSSFKRALIPVVGGTNILFGLCYIAFGVYVLAAGADAVATVFHAKKELSKAAQEAAPAGQAVKVDAAIDKGAKGLAGVFLAMASVVAGCSMLQGLPLVFVGIGIFSRSGWARILGLLFATLGGLEGIACLTALSDGVPVYTAGGVLLAYTLLSFIALPGQTYLQRDESFAQQEESAARFSSERMNMPGAAPVAAAPVPASSGYGAVIAATLASTVVAVVATLFVVFGFLWPDPTKIDPAAKKKQEPKKEPATAEERIAAFHEAVDKGQVSQALALIKKGVNVNDRDEHGDTALMRACYNGQTEMTILLLSHGAQVNERDQKGRTPLIVSAQRGQASLMPLLLAKDSALSQIQAFRDRFPLELPKVDLKDVPGFNKDLKLPDLKGLIPALVFRLTPADVDAQDKEGRTALMYAGLAGHGHIVKQLVSAKAELELTDKEGFTAWMLAANEGQLETMRLLLPQSPAPAYLQRKNKAGKTAFELAAVSGHMDVVAHLKPLLGDLVKEVKIEPKKQEVGQAGDSPLFKAVRTGDFDAVQTIVSQNIPIDGRDDKGRTALMLAAEKGDARITLLLANQAGRLHPKLIDARDASGQTALMYAAAAGHSETVEALLTALAGGFNRGELLWYRCVHHKDKAGKDAFDLGKEYPAVMDKLEAYCKSMLEKRADVNLMSGLEQASAEGDLTSVEGLLKRGAARVYHISAAGYTMDEKTKRPRDVPSALMHASEKGHILVVRALLDSFANNHSALLGYLDASTNITSYSPPFYSPSAEKRAVKEGHFEIAALLRERHKEAQEGKTRVPPPKVVEKPKKIEPKPPEPTVLAAELVKAIEAGELDAVKSLLADDRAVKKLAVYNSYLTDAHGRTVVILAAAKGHHHLVLWLCSKLRKRDKSSLIFAADKDGKTPLIVAAARGDKDTTASLLLALATGWETGKLNWFEHLYHRDKSKKNALEQASGPVKDVLKKFHEDYKNRSSAAYVNVTAVELAARENQVALLKDMLAAGCSPERGAGSDYTALQLASKNGHAEVVKTLLASFKDKEERIRYVQALGKSGNTSETSLMRASSNGNIHIVEALLAAFEDKQSERVKFAALPWTGTTNKIVPTALGHAAFEGHVLVVKALLEAFRDDSVSRRRYIEMSGHPQLGGAAALAIAEQRNHREIVTLLRQYLNEK